MIGKTGLKQACKCALETIIKQPKVSVAIKQFLEQVDTLVSTVFGIDIDNNFDIIHDL